MWPRTRSWTLECMSILYVRISLRCNVGPYTMEICVRRCCHRRQQEDCHHRMFFLCCGSVTRMLRREPRVGAYRTVPLLARRLRRRSPCCPRLPPPCPPWTGPWAPASRTSGTLPTNPSSAGPVQPITNFILQAPGPHSPPRPSRTSTRPSPRSKQTAGRCSTTSLAKST